MRERLLHNAHVAGWTLSSGLVARAYTRLWRQHGLSPKSLGERADQKTYAFYDSLFAGVVLPAAPTVLDVGCGPGHLIDFLHTHGIAPRRYLGIDLVPPFVAQARQRYSSPYEFRVTNLVSDRFWPSERFDVVVALGVLVTRVWAYEAYLRYALWKMVRLSRDAVLCNGITALDTKLGNYANAPRLGQYTMISKHRLTALLDEVAAATGAQYTLRDVQVYPDATDTFVYLRTKGPC